MRGAHFNFDIHNLDGFGLDPRGCQHHFSQPDGYTIPYGCLVPEKIEGLLVAGRCSSMDHGAMAATRVMSTVMAMGEAAGTAARVALEDGVDPSVVDIKRVQNALLENGGYLG